MVNLAFYVNWHLATLIEGLSFIQVFCVKDTAPSKLCNINNKFYCFRTRGICVGKEVGSSTEKHLRQFTM